MLTVSAAPSPRALPRRWTSPVLAEVLSGTRARPTPLTLEHAAVLLFTLLSAVYFWQATTLAARAPLWMDEILTLWTARLPDTVAIWSALVRGAEFTPPLNDWLIHALLQAGVTSPLGLRLPSILAIYVTALATGAIVRRHAGIAPAALAAGVVLTSGLFGYAVQMRPYALVTAAFASALALYDRAGPRSALRLAAMAALLALAIALHFYALLLAVGLGLLELVRARIERRAQCWRTLAAVALAGCSILLWLPILIAARGYSGADIAAPSYYAHPTLLALIRTYAMLLGWLIVPLTGLLAAALLVKREGDAMRITALTVIALPLLVFAFAAVISHSYADRYALAGAIGIALLFASLANRLGPQASVLILSLLIAATPWRSAGEVGKVDRLDALAVVEAAPQALPIVTGSGLRFFELRENSRLADRLVFLDTPGMQSSDPTNANQARRWKSIDPSLPVAEAQAFVCATPAFYLFAQPRDGGADSLQEWLAGHADFTPPPTDRASLTLVRAKSCTDTQ